MKNKTTEKKPLYKIVLFSIFILLLNGVPHLAFSQDYPAPPAQKLNVPYVKPKTVEHTAPFSGQNFPPDFVSPQHTIKGKQQQTDTAHLKKTKKTSATPPKKLTPNQNKKNVEPDKILGKDMQGRQLYKDSEGEIYYVDHGVKVIVK